MIKRFFLGILILLLLLSTPFQLQAQNVASITGVITDNSGAVISDVNVLLENPQTGATYRTTSNTGGSYTFKQIEPGPGYRITFTHDGFTSVSISGLYMNVDATRTQNAQMALGTTQQTIEVSAANQDVTLNTTDATVGNNFQVQFLNDLPVADRDSPAVLFTQQPGVTLDGAVSGARVDQNNVTLDGLDVNDNQTGNFGAIVGNAPIDSVQEFRGVSASPLASAGEGGGGQFELVTRSGSNVFHGALVEYHRDTDLEANDWFNNNAGVARPPLIRNQFGGNLGGPILKDKLFFFFDYNGRRDTLSNLVERTVPLDGFRNGNLAYRNAGNTISTLNSAQVAALDPQKIGFNSALLNLISSRYPHANDLTGTTGDLLNTAGFRFNAPFPYKEDDYVQRIDFALNSKMMIYGVGHFTRTNGTQTAIQFPGDPETYPFLDQSYSWVVGQTWSISDTMVNQVSYGETYENYSFPNTYNPTGITQFGDLGGNGTGGSLISGPYASAVNAQGRTFPIPVVRDDFSWQKGAHSLSFGGSFKYISPDNNVIYNYNQPSLGLGGNTSSLNPGLRPGDIGSGNAVGLYDGAFALALAPYTATDATYNYNSAGNVLPQGSGFTQDFRYYETELYVGDTWKVTPSLTLSYGLRWQNYSVPYERHGLEALAQFGNDPVSDSTFDNYFGARVAQSAAGASGNLAVPLISYVLGGKVNHGPGYYNPQNKDFAPRVAFAYSPSFDPKTIFNGGGGIIYDHTVVSALQYQQTQFNYIFKSTAKVSLGTVGDPVASLQSDQRFGGLGSPVAPPPPPSVTTPNFPFVTGSGANAVPNGLINGGAYNETIDSHFKTPYSIQYNFGFQHEFPQGYILKTTYVGRLGRRLMAQADADQLVDFPDRKSGQELSAAFGSITQQLRNGVAPKSVAAQPWFENVIAPGLGVANGYASNTAMVASTQATFVQRGDFADTMQQLAAAGWIPPNVGMASQFSENTIYTNKGFSSYNGLLVTLHKNVGYGLQFDLNYTWSHSIDNVSVTANTVAYGGYGFICDVLRPRECRGNSDFDVTNYLNGNFIYDLPFGRGKTFGASASRWLNEAIGGWKLSGLPSWHTGQAYFAGANAFVAGYANNAPAILTGPISDLKVDINGGKGQPLYAFSNPQKTNADFTGPVGFDIGSRNNLRAPGYFDMDMGLGNTVCSYTIPLS